MRLQRLWVICLAVVAVLVLLGASGDDGAIQVAVDGAQPPVLLDGATGGGDPWWSVTVGLGDLVSMTVLGGIIVSITRFVAKMQRTIAVCNVTWDVRYEKFLDRMTFQQQQAKEELRHAVEHWDVKIGQVIEEINRIRESREKHESMVYQHELKLAVMREELDYVKAHLRVPPAPLTLT